MPGSVRVFCERVGGGFGRKQEMLTEDICALAPLKTGRPVKLEFIREEQFIATTTRHPMAFDDSGRMINPTFRNYRIPAYADVPQRTEIYFVKTHDAFGPLGAKSMSEAPIYPIAPALANASGVRFYDSSMTPDRIYRRIFENNAVTKA